MIKNIQRLGVLPYLILAAGLMAGSVWWLNRLINSVWPIDPDLPPAQFADLQRAVVLQRGQATLIMQAGNGEAIVAFLIGVIFLGMGAVLPLLYFVNRRLGRRRGADGVPGRALPVRPAILLRQGFLFGGWVAFCIWLQMNRSLGIIIAGLVALVFLLLEGLLQVAARQKAESGAPVAATPPPPVTPRSTGHPSTRPPLRSARVKPRE